jgi:1,2-dihydroxy-3-keto-5-methylthiopentene dioxygenase
VRFEQWPTRASHIEEPLLETYKEEIAHLMQENGYQAVDVVAMDPYHPQKEALRQTFLQEHTHSEDEVRFFVEGAAHFFMHVDGKVYIVLCEQGDLISIPARYPHWFDMGQDPQFTAIRFFTDKTGWVADVTGSDISTAFLESI